MHWTTQSWPPPDRPFDDITVLYPGQPPTPPAWPTSSPPPGKENSMADWTASSDGALTPNTVDIMSPNLTLSGSCSATGPRSRRTAVISASASRGPRNNGLNIANAGVKYVGIHVKPGGDWTFDPQSSGPTASAPTTVTGTVDGLVVGTAFSSQTLTADGNRTDHVVDQGRRLASRRPAPSMRPPASFRGTPTAGGAYSFHRCRDEQCGKRREGLLGHRHHRQDGPDKPSGSSANKVDVADPAKGAKTVVVPSRVQPTRARRSRPGPGRSAPTWPGDR